MCKHRTDEGLFPRDKRLELNSWLGAPHPSCFACHLLPQGEKVDKAVEDVTLQSC